jgi:hypothetical protein
VFSTERALKIHIKVLHGNKALNETKVNSFAEQHVQLPNSNDDMEVIAPVVLYDQVDIGGDNDDYCFFQTTNTLTIDNKYLAFQYKLYEYSFGLESLQCNSYDSYCAAVQDKFRYESPNLHLAYEYFTHAETFNVGQVGMENLIKSTRARMVDAKIPRDLIDRCMPSSYESCKTKAMKGVKLFEIKVKSIPFPETFEIYRWKNSPRPLEISIRCRDILMAIAECLISPEIMFGWKDHVTFEAAPKFLNGVQYRSDGFSSDWAIKTQELIRTQKSYIGHLLGIIIYDDKVQLNNQTNSEAVFATLLNFSDELMRQDIGKLEMGFIVGRESINDILMINHLMQNNSKKFSKTQAKLMLKDFYRKLHNDFWELCLDSVKAAYDAGITLQVLGLGELLFYPVLAFHVGDEPSQKVFCGCYESNASMR